MAYKDRLRKASFRGVEFFLETGDMEGGKRVVMFQFAGRNTPYTESLGRNGHVYSITGYLIGDNVFALRDEFARACERDGYGVLVHPFYGNLNVECGVLKFSQSIVEGRIVRFSVEFYEKGEAKTPSAAANKVGKFFTKINSSLTSVKENFADKFEVADLPQYVLESATTVVQTANDVFLEVFGQLSNPSEYVANIKKSILDFQDNLELLLTNTTDFADDLVDIISSIGSITNSHKNKQEIYNKILNFDSELMVFPETTTTRTTQRQNEDALVNLIKTTTYAMAMRDFVSAVNDTFPDDETALQDAQNDIYYSFAEIEVRQRELFEGFSDITTSDINGDIFHDLNELSSLLFESLPSPDDAESKIKRVVTYTLPETNHSLVLAYDLYESPDNEQDLVNRNGVENPNFVLGGQELEILSP